MRNHDGIHDGVSLYGRAKSVIPVSSETRFGLRQHLGIHLRRLVNVRRPTDRGGHSTYRREIKARCNSDTLWIAATLRHSFPTLVNCAPPNWMWRPLSALVPSQ